MKFRELADGKIFRCKGDTLVKTKRFPGPSGKWDNAVSIETGILALVADNSEVEPCCDICASTEVLKDGEIFINQHGTAVMNTNTAMRLVEGKLASGYIKLRRENED